MQRLEWLQCWEDRQGRHMLTYDWEGFPGWWWTAQLTSSMVHLTSPPLTWDRPNSPVSSCQFLRVSPDFFSTPAFSLYGCLSRSLVMFGDLTGLHFSTSGRNPPGPLLEAYEKACGSSEEQDILAAECSLITQNFSMQCLGHFMHNSPLSSCCSYL